MPYQAVRKLIVSPLYIARPLARRRDTGLLWGNAHAMSSSYVTLSSAQYLTPPCPSLHRESLMSHQCGRHRSGYGRRSVRRRRLLRRHMPPEDPPTVCSHRFHDQDYVATADRQDLGSDQSRQQMFTQY